MIRRHVLIVVAAALAALFSPAAVAAAQPVPTPEPGAVTGQQSASRLPDNFPQDLRKFIGGTEEFKNGPWFTGKCRDQGGDLGLYISEALSNENRLLYWTASDEQKVDMVGGATLTAGSESAAVGTVEAAEKAVADGTEPPEEALPTVFPAGDTSFHPPAGTCAGDLARWGTKEWSTWGFAWTASPDADSLTAIKELPGADTVPGSAWSDPCAEGSGDQYCMHAFFVDCAQAERADASRCQDWNLSIGRLFAGTANWIDQNTGFLDRVKDTLGRVIQATPQYKLGKAYVQAFSWVAGAAGDVVDFVKDPATVIDDWANSTKSGALSLTDAVLRGLTSTGDFDPTQPWFLTWYAASTGLGMMVMSFAVLIAITRSRQKGSPAELVANVFGYLPAGIVMMLFSLVAAQFLLELAKAITDGITAASGTTVTEMVDNIYNSMSAMNNETVVGGSIVGLIFFGLLLLGALSVYIGLLLHQIGLPLAACVAGIGYGMWVHPTWRVKALRPVLTFVGLVFSKPLLFLLIAIVLTGANNSLLSGGGGSGDLTSLGSLALVAASMVLVGLAPWALLKWAPILPTRADSEGFGSGGGSIAGGVIGGLGSSALFRGRSGGGNRVSEKTSRDSRSTPSGSGLAATGHAPHSAAFHPHASAAGRSGGHTPGSEVHSSSRGSASKLGMAGRLGGRLAKGSAGGLVTAAAVAVPIAAQSASAAMNKAKAGAETAATESESR
ncbi:hypothetical protein HQ346_14390 [Rhodococcus sp. BP-252]|uniref:hypothetical protein n=1 Tax=unclassified Rhodococcus (in: high G+C Gram-positive bacteria) TaxID=192944 RepID=UPI001C9AEE44|nr:MULTISPECIES: hypothetical protein [unclassified Rhodococcus (in: high G+C Gram-positive bacteria)]MBY6412872.1 hypothetical protein [Rhodococcus sp. BP-320]MBY6417591.1 hypothetical protein [Rhodococcus sp. BP-321]MBY6423037.1 hypothetical protein [Rhodococcus sp. BP-324]MBY6427615.1 hypothetical protein [Rhodococcus sp. BP-323]MBY6432779.1 hypothetical protein [Rhodococcus sp. BP-322]